MKEREFSGIIKRKKSQLKVLFNDRLLAGFDIARAMKYLHDHDIMYRDLKPGEFLCLNWFYQESSFISCCLVLGTQIQHFFSYD